MTTWLRQLPYNPIPLLLNCGSPAVEFFARRDLLGEDAGSVQRLWSLPDAEAILRHQMRNGGWKYPAPRARVRSAEDYNQIETYRNLGFLVEKYGFTRKHPAVQKAAEFLYAFQTGEGDFHGIYGSQYSPNYSAGILELLIKAGYEKDRHIAKGMCWLLSIRQQDGGWAIPSRTDRRKWDVSLMRSKTLMPNRALPFSHLATGVALRAFAAHPRYSGLAEVQYAGRLLASRFFRRDAYPDRQAVSFWTGFSFPFWFTDLLSALDSLSRLGFSPDEPEIRKALDWFAKRQGKDGGCTY